MNSKIVFIDGCNFMWCTKFLVFHNVIVSIDEVVDIANLKYFQGEYFVKRPLLVGLILAFEHVLRNEAWHPIGVPSVVQFLVPQCLKSNNTKSGGNTYKPITFAKKLFQSTQLFPSNSSMVSKRLL